MIQAVALGSVFHLSAFMEEPHGRVTLQAFGLEISSRNMFYAVIGRH